MTNPFLIFVVLVLLILGIQKIAAFSWGQKILSFLPVPFWCYIIPMLLSNAKIIPEKSELYGFLSLYLLPFCILLLLTGTDMNAIKKMGTKTLLIMLVGAVGTLLGGIVSFLLFKSRLPENAWMLVGALSGSWIGGSLNMIAVKEILGISDASIGPLILVDATIAYGWMAFLIWISNFQKIWQEKIIKQKEEIKTTELADDNGVRTNKKIILIWLVSAVALTFLLNRLGNRLPAVGTILNAASWPILMTTLVACLLSLTPLSKLKDERINKIASFSLLILLTSIGARAHFATVGEAPVLFSMGCVWILIHGLTLLVGGFFLKSPLGLMATSSQANIGGPISAPIVGATYNPCLAGLGLLMALLGNLLGTYLGVAAALLARALL